MNLVTRSDFDGIACAVLLKHVEIIEKITFTEPREVQDRLIEITSNDIIANLPYSISNPLLFKLTEHRNTMEWATLMLQKEVAERLSAEPGTKD